MDEFERQTEIRKHEVGDGNGKEWAAIRRGWFFGDDALKAELLATVSERVVREELERLGWREGELRRRSKGDAGKVMIARRVRRETTMTLAWIANRLGMGTWTYVSNLLSRIHAVEISRRDAEARRETGNRESRHS